MTSKDSKRLRNIRKAREKKALKKAARLASRQVHDSTTTAATRAKTRPMFASVSMPRVTEDDLLAFQFTHFGDDSKPHNWFVDAHTALSVQQSQSEVTELGLYPDGEKRTLTDEQIAIFRRTELQELLRQYKEKSANANLRKGNSPWTRNGSEPRRAREDSQRRKGHKNTQGSRPYSNITAGERRVRETEIPYAERHKRKWEKYIVAEDSVKGAMTERRLARERDNSDSTPVELDYG